MEKKFSMLEQVHFRLSIIDCWLDNKHIPWKTDSNGKELRSDTGELIADYAPVNLKQFCDWTSENSSRASGVEVLKIRRISRTNFFQPYHVDLRSRVEAKLKSLRACLKFQCETKNKSSVIAYLEQEVDFLRKVVDAQSSECRIARQNIAEVTLKYRNRHEEQRRIIFQLKNDLKNSEKRISELTNAISNISPLRVAKLKDK